MTTAIDSNVLIALWNSSDALNRRAQNALDKTNGTDDLVICGAVYAELLAYQGRTEAMVDNFLNSTGISVEWEVNESMWRSAARANHQYAARRRKQNQAEPRRLLTDFLVGAHAVVKGYPLLTFDNRIFRAAYPKLKVIS